MTPPEKRPYSAEMPDVSTLRLLDRVLDEDVVRRAEQVVVHVDAVDHEHVVVGEAAGDRHLSAVRRVRGQARRELGDQRRRPAGRQLVDLARRVVARQRSATSGPAVVDLGRHVDVLLDPGDRQRAH